MSPAQLPTARGETPGRLLAALKRLLRKQGGAGYVDRETLQTASGLSRRSVQYGLRVLAQQGKVVVTVGRGRGVRSTYRLVEGDK